MQNLQNGHQKIKPPNHDRLIFSKIGKICSKVGRLPGSSFMQIRISRCMCTEMSRLNCSRRSSRAIFMPTSIGLYSANGTDRVTISQSSTANDHMSLALRLISPGFFCSASGDIQAGWKSLFLSWNENFVSAMFTLADRSSSIWVGGNRCS